LRVVRFVFLYLIFLYLQEIPVQGKGGLLHGVFQSVFGQPALPKDDDLPADDMMMFSSIYCYSIISILSSASAIPKL
jgi:hypothetical protein